MARKTVREQARELAQRLMREPGNISGPVIDMTRMMANGTWPEKVRASEKRRAKILIEELEKLGVDDELIAPSLDGLVSEEDDDFERELRCEYN